MEVDEIVSGDVAPFILRFRARQKLGRDYRASLRLVGWGGQRIAKDFDLRTAPLTGEPTSGWTPNQEFEVRQGLWLPVLALHQERTRCSLSSTTGQICSRSLHPWPGDPVSGAVAIGLLDVTMPPKSPSARARLLSCSPYRRPSPTTGIISCSKVYAPSPRGRMHPATC